MGEGYRVPHGMVECAFPFGFAPRDGVGGYSIKKPTARDLQLQQDL
eukprot:COSAG01_NODE_24889_length_762_cov_12.466063_2_plen_45_part_01